MTDLPMTKADDDLVEHTLTPWHATAKENARLIVEAVNNYDRLRAQLAAAEEELGEWKQAASVEAGLRREFLARTEAAEAQLQAMRKALEAGSFQARQWIRKAKGPRDRAVAIAFESFCNEALRSLTEGAGK